MNNEQGTKGAETAQQGKVVVATLVALAAERNDKEEREADARRHAERS